MSQTGRPTVVVDGESRVPGCTPPVFVVLSRPGRHGYEVVPAQHCGQVSGPVALFMDVDLSACRRGQC